MPIVSFLVYYVIASLLLLIVTSQYYRQKIYNVSDDVGYQVQVFCLAIIVMDGR